MHSALGDRARSQWTRTWAAAVASFLGPPSGPRTVLGFRGRGAAEETLTVAARAADA